MLQLRLFEKEQLHLVVHVQLSHVSFSRKFMYLVVEGAIPKYLGWWLDNISTSLGHVNHEKEIVQWMGPSLTSAVLQEMCQLKYLRRNTSPPLSIHLSNTCSSFSFSDLSSLQHLYDMTMHELVIDNLPTPSGRPAFKRALHLHLDYYLDICSLNSPGFSCERKIRHIHSLNLSHPVTISVWQCTIDLIVKINNLICTELTLFIVYLFFIGMI